MRFLANIESGFNLEALEKGVRMDGRGFHEARGMEVVFRDDLGAVECAIGQTRALAKVSCEIVKPYKDRPYEGFLIISAEPNTLASFNPNIYSKLTEDESSTIQALDKALRKSNAIDLEALCIVAGHKVWSLRVDIHFVNDCGNLVDCASIAAMTALRHFRRPDVTLEGEEVTVHSFEERVPVPLAIHHCPICVSFAFFPNNRTVLDPSLIESQLSTGSLTLTLNPHREICVLSKVGGAPLTASEIIKVVTLASQRVDAIEEFVKKKLAQEDKRRFPNIR